MKYLLIDFPFLIGMGLISFPILYYLRLKVRVIRFREDIFEARDYLFDVAMERGCLTDPAVKRADEHLFHLTRIVDILSPRLMIALLGHIPPTTEEHPARNVEVQKVIEEMYMLSAQRTWEYLFTESLSMRTARLMGPYAEKVWGFCEATWRKWRQRNEESKISQQELERFIQSEAPVEISLKVNPFFSSAQKKRKHAYHTPGRA